MRFFPLLTILLWTSSARADEDSDGGTMAESDYHGVAPGAPNLPPLPPKLPITNGPQRLTWTGFQTKDGKALVFLELTNVPQYQVADARGHVTVTLKNTKVPIRNNRRPLKVALFETPVETITARERGHDVEVTVQVKGKPTHSEHVEKAAGGFQLLIIEFSK